jgi:hypothetical protein
MLFRHLLFTAVLLCAALAPAVSFAQSDSSSAQPSSPAAQPTPDTPAGKSKWHCLLEPYMMFPNMNGTVGIGNLPESHLDENPGDIFSHFQFGAMLYAEAYNDKWLVSSDFTYMSLGQDITGKLIAFGHIDIKQLGWELAILKRIKPWLSLGLAGQLNNIKSDIDVAINTSTTPTTKSSSFSKTWVDPSVVAAIKMPLASKWSLRFRGNIGGFGIASKIYWQTQLYVDYHVSKNFQLSAGYRAIKVDYEKGSDADKFLYNVTTFGPIIRFGFNF